MQDRVRDGNRRASLKRQAPREHLVKDDAEGEEVAAHVDGFSEELLGRHVGERPERGAFARQLGPRARRVPAFESLREAEVEDLHLSAGGQHDVPALDVAVKNPGPVRLGERIRNLDTGRERLRSGERTFRERCVERSAVNELHDE